MMKKEHFTGLENEAAYRTFFKNADIRRNLLEWYEFSSESIVLVVNEREGSLIRLLEEKCAEVTGVMSEELWELPESSYDVILHMGVVEADTAGINSTYKKYFSYYREHLKKQGVLLLAVPNRLGLRYFAGCQDEIYDGYFIGIEGYKAGMTKQALSKKEYEMLLTEAGFWNIEGYYPYPDYRFPVAVYSEEWLPGEGDLNANIRNFDKDRYHLFNESKVYDSLIREGLYKEFANSFLYICSLEVQKKKEKVLFSKFSNERAPQFQIRTDIVEKQNGERCVVKYPLKPEAEFHVKKMQEAYERLTRECEDENISFCPVRWNGKGAESPFARGKTLQEILHDKLEAGDTKEALELVKDFVERYRSYLIKREECSGSDSKEVRQRKSSDIEGAAAETTFVNNIDMVFSNIFVEGDKWTVIDYEWSFEKEIPADFMLYRVLFRASIDLSSFEAMQLNHLLDLADISETEAAEYRKMEEEFQNYINGREIPARDMVSAFGRQVIPFMGNRDKQEKEAERLINLYGKKAVKILVSIDKTESRNGRVVCSGWACAKVREYGYIPVEIKIFDEDGNTVDMPVKRTSRQDVGAVLKTKGRKEEYIGFDAVFHTPGQKKYTIRFSAGRCQKEILLTGVEN